MPGVKAEADHTRRRAHGKVVDTHTRSGLVPRLPRTPASTASHLRSHLEAALGWPEPPPLEVPGRFYSPHPQKTPANSGGPAALEPIHLGSERTTSSWHSSCSRAPPGTRQGMRGS